MHVEQHILGHFLFGTEAFLVHDHEVAAMRAAQVFDHLEAESAETVAVGDDQTLDAAMDDAIENAQEARAVEIEAAADFPDPFVYCPAVRRAELLQYADLVVEARYLRLRRHPGVGCGNPPAPSRRPACKSQVLLGIKSPVARRTLWLETSLPVPTVERADRHANQIGELSDIVRVHTCG